MANYGPRGHGRGYASYDKARKRWRGQVTIAGKRHTVQGRTEGEVHKALDKLLDAPEAEAEEVDGNPTVREWFALWVNELADTESENNRANRIWAGCKFADIHGMRMNDVLAPHVDKVLRSYAKKGYARNTIVRMRSVLGMAYDSYNGRNGRTFNPARLAKFGKTKPRPEKAALPPKQAGDLLKVANTDTHGIIVHLGLWLGLRPGEVTGLAWEAVNFGTGELSVVQMCRRNPDGSLEMVAPKADSYRNLVMPPPLVDALRRHKAAQVRKGLWAASGLVVCTHEGGPLDPSNVRREVKRMAEAAGIKVHFTPNQLRHTAASLLINVAKLSEVEVADQLGHTDTRMVQKHYRKKYGRTVDNSAAMVGALGAAS